VSCRSPTSSLITPLGFFSRGAPPPPRSSDPVTATSRTLYTTVRASSLPWSHPSARADKGHVPLYTTVWASGLPWSRPSAHAPARAYRLLLPRRDCLPTRLPQRDRPGCNASPQDREFTPSGSLAGPVTVRDHARLRPASVSRLLLPRRDCLPTRLPQRDRPGCNASPQDREVHTVRLPRGTGHGKGPCPAQARIGFPKSSWSRPQRASTVYRSRQSAPEPCLTRPPADSTHGRHKARCALQSIPFVQLSWRRTLTGTGTDWTT
jgi:hypothetical protein